MGVEIRLITGMMVGIELITYNNKNVLVIDLAIIRLLVFSTD